MQNEQSLRYFDLRAAKGPHSEEYDFPVIAFLKQVSVTHTIIFVEQGGTELKNAFVTLDKPAFFIMGNEGNGIPEQILTFQPSMRVSIPQYGVGRSHNVANAASIVLWEYFR